jgi:hypothetical protein
MRLRWLLSMPILGAAALLGGAAALAPILAFNRIQPGAWQLRALGDSAPPRRLCIQDAYDLIQIRHPGAACSRFVLANEAQSATVHYTCTGTGYGRTTITVETSELIRIESQGIANRSPFQVALEGRRVGGCGQEQASR